MKYRRIKGTKDILPDEISQWQFIEKNITEALGKNNYREIRTPVFEMTELFARSIGEDTDVVSKEMYTFTDKGGKSLTLRPELTAPVIRAYIQNNLDQISPLMKLYYIGSLFRQERPQKGRLRQFNQFGFEIIGTPHPEADAEVIQTMYEIFTQLGITKLEIKLNSIGGRESRTKYLEILKKSLQTHLSDFCPTCQKRYNENILRLFDCKSESCQDLLDEFAPTILEHLNVEDAAHFEEVKSLLDITNTPYLIDNKLVRGLDYYTRTTFEISSSLLGSQDAICGGGRYDHLIKDLGGKATPSVGVACGMERLLLVLNELNAIPEASGQSIYCVVLGEKARLLGFQIVSQIRKNGLTAEMDFMRRSMKAQMRAANKQNARWVIIIGDNEIANNYIILKDMKNNMQQEISLKNGNSAIVEYIRNST